MKDGGTAKSQCYEDDERGSDVNDLHLTCRAPRQQLSHVHFRHIAPAQRVQFIASATLAKTRKHSSSFNMPQVQQSLPVRDPYVYTVQCETWKETFDDEDAMDDYEEPPRFTLVGVFSTIRSANLAARSYAMRDPWLPGAGEREGLVEVEIVTKGLHSGCHKYHLDLHEYASYDHDIVRARVQVKKIWLNGPNLALGQTDDDDHEHGKEAKGTHGLRGGTRDAVAKPSQSASIPEQSADRARLERAEKFRNHILYEGGGDQLFDRMVLHKQAAARAQSGTSASRSVTPAKRPPPAATDDDEIQFVKEVKRP